MKAKLVFYRDGKAEIDLEVEFDTSDPQEATKVDEFERDIKRAVARAMTQPAPA